MNRYEAIAAVAEEVKDLWLQLGVTEHETETETAIASDASVNSPYIENYYCNVAVDVGEIIIQLRIK